MCIIFGSECNVVSGYPINFVRCWWEFSWYIIISSHVALMIDLLMCKEIWSKR